MKPWMWIATAWRNLIYGEQVECQLDEEVRGYVEMVTEERIASGMEPAEARRTAMAEFGGIEQVKQAVRDRRSGSGVERLVRDVRLGMRQLRRNPGFAMTVVATLAFSIGANTAIFSVVNALMLRSLPYAQPDRIGTIYTQIRGGGAATEERHHVNGEQWLLLRDNVPALISAVSSIRTSGVNLRSGSQVQYLHAGRVSAHYFDVLGIRPVVGRNFTEAEDRPQGAKTAILSYGLWWSTVGGDRGTPGQTILLKGEPYTVIGILPEGATTPLNADLYTALQPARDGEGGGTNYEAITRLRDGATWQEADAEINRAWLHRASRYELENNPGAQVSYFSVPLQRGLTAVLRPQALALMLAAGCILMIACANLAGLTLVRMARREPELATRLALGASQWQIQKQLWVENLILALLGGAAGLGVGFAALRGLVQVLPEHFLPVADVSLDGRVLGFTTLVSLLTSVGFGMLPALTTRRYDLRSAIGTRNAVGGERSGLRQALIAGEVALTIVLLAAAGLLIRTLVHLQTLPPGFDASGVMTARASLDEARYHDAAAFRKLLDESLAGMRRIPGVEDAAVGLSLPYERSLIMAGIELTGKEGTQKAIADEVYVTPGYFSTLRIPVAAGRSFTEADGPDTQPVAVVNRAFASKYFGGADAVGQYLNKDLRIVGVVESVAMAPGVDAVAPLTGEETLYVPAKQMGGRQLSFVHLWFQPSWVVRTAGPLEGLTGEMHRALASVDPDVSFSGFYSMRDLLAKTLAAQRAEVALLGTMAGLALLLSGVGIFALVANMVAQRTREIGIRMALGSTIRQAMVQIGSPGVRASALGLTAGLGLCAGVLRAMRSVLYGVGIYDATTIAAAVLILVLVTMIATIVPSLRVARIDPARTLRDE